MYRHTAILISITLVFAISGCGSKKRTSVTPVKPLQIAYVGDTILKLHKGPGFWDNLANQIVGDRQYGERVELVYMGKADDNSLLFQKRNYTLEKPKKASKTGQSDESEQSQANTDNLDSELKSEPAHDTKANLVIEADRSSFEFYGYIVHVSFSSKEELRYRVKRR